MGSSVVSQEDISREAVKHFQKAYSRNGGSDINDILWGIEPYRIMFDEKQNDLLYAKVTEEELLLIMKSFQKDKSSGPDGRTIDFFIRFFDILKSDILNMVEESRTKGSINHLISSTYIALIPKRKPSLTFMDFRPISLCNTLYKIISKLIVERMWNMLSVHITLE